MVGMSKDKFDYFIKGDKDNYEVIIGLEVHAQVLSKSKLFSGSSTKFGGEPNKQVSLIDSAFPGMLPVINEECVKQAVRTGLGLNAKINNYSVFDRKNYFYADLPQGYQISQYKNPIVGEGKVLLDMPYGSKQIGIERLHLEQDAGKSIHDLDPSNTYVDLNRSGIALMEIVSKPDLRSPDEVNAYIKKLRSIMRYLGTCDGNMQEGSLRADVNVSVRKIGDKKFGTRCEIKNVNSIKFMQMAIEYEAARQVELLESGKQIDQETRLFDTKKNETRSMRSKEDAHDYRYFPDPDLQAVIVTEEYIAQVKSQLPPLPKELYSKFTTEYGLSDYDTNILIEEKGIALYYNELCSHTKKFKSAANFVNGSVRSYLNENAVSISDFSISTEQLATLISIVDNERISNSVATSKVFPAMLSSNKTAEEIAAENNWVLESDSDALGEYITQVIAKYPEKVAQYKGGQKGLIGLFMGEVMKLSKGQADPKLANQLLKTELEK